MSRNPEKTLIFRLIAAGHLARRAVQAPLAGAHLTPGDDAILIALRAMPDIAVGDLLAATGLDHTGLVRRLRQLETLGLVSIARDEVALSLEGAALAGMLLDRWDAVDRDLAAAVSDGEAKAIRKALRRIAETLAPGS